MKTRILQLTIEPEEIEKIYKQNLGKVVVEAIITHANVKLTAKTEKYKLKTKVIQT